MRAIPILVSLTVILALVPGGVGAQAEGEPVLDATVADNRLVPGEEQTLQVTLTNEGELSQRSPNPGENQRVTTARGLSVEADDEDVPLNVRTGTQSIGSLPEGGTASLPIAVSVDEDADPGTYDLPIEVNYTHASQVTARSEETSTVNETLNATVVIEDDARLSVLEVEPTVRVGSTDTVAVTVENTGTEIARDATLTEQSRNADLTVGGSASATRYLGEWETGEQRTVAVETTVARTATPQPYAVDVSLEYEDARGTRSTSETRTVAITPRAQQTFSVVETESAVAVGDEGTVSVTMRNEGPLNASDATVRLASTSPDLAFSGSGSATRFVGEWASNETRTLTYDLKATQGADTREYALEATVSYQDEDGDSETAPTRSIGVQPGPEQSFTIDNVSATLAVGAEGNLRGTVTNTGDAAVRNAVVVFQTQKETITAIEREHPVGDLGPGGSSSFHIPLEISESAESGPQQYSLSIQYRNQNGDRQESDTFDVRQTVGPDVPEFELEADGGTTQPGESTQLEVTVTNAGDERFTDISATVFADSPVSAVDDEAFVPALEPGESTTVTFEVGAAGSALPKAYPLSIDFQYDDSDGDTLVSDTYRLPLTVEETEDEGLPLIPIAVGLVVLVAAGFYAYRRYY
jgi:hypothetical protein